MRELDTKTLLAVVATLDGVLSPLRYEGCSVLGDKLGSLWPQVLRELVALRNMHHHAADYIKHGLATPENNRLYAQAQRVHLKDVDVVLLAVQELLTDLTDQEK
ncbi:hypothetical protein LCGC14_0409870 [marine sediment metagenome]|uniref:Uncharacterized protein n=1 Tax=marine sediment metagenome TaxID=412755 RepID=A0A0F9W358_9ZZZZ